MSDRLVYFEPGLPGIPEDLLLARDRGEVLFMTGAGVSTPPPSSLPNFRGLVVDIYRRLDMPLAQAMDAFLAEAARTDPVPANWTAHTAGLDAKQQTELKRFAAGEYDVALGMLERRMSGAPEAASRMRAAAAEVLNAAREPNTLHASLDRLGRRFGQSFIATTNFDRLHERAAGRRVALRSYGLSALPRPSRRADFHGIFHIHGALSEGPQSPAEIVLTDQDFGDVYLRRRITSDFIYDAIRIFHLVIIGYSLNDAPFRYLLNAIAGDSLHFPDLKTRYAIVPRNGEDQTVAEEWKARFIEPVCYDAADHHRQVQDLMAAWAKSTPESGSDAWAKGRLRIMCRGRFADTSEEDKSVFGYILRRAPGVERTALLTHMGQIGADPDWLTAANRIVRDLRDGG